MSGPDQITVPVRDWSVNYLVRSVVRNLVRDYVVRSVVRDFGPKIFGPVRGPEFWSEIIWSGPLYVVLVRIFRTGPRWSGP